MNWDTIREELLVRTHELSLPKLADLKFADWLRTWYAQNQQEIIVLGCSGVGKTQFIYSLNEKTEEKLAGEPTRRHNITKLKQDKAHLHFIDTVGDFEGANERKGVFEKRLNNEKLTGIINIVNYGYQEKDTQRKHNIFRYDTFEVEEAFLEANRNEELLYLSDWLPYLHLSQVKWIITLVNKMDVWKPIAGKVQAYYEDEESDYQQYIRHVFLQRNIKNIEHRVLPYTSALEPFWGKRPIFVGEFDKRLIQRYFRKNLLELINA